MAYDDELTNRIREIVLVDEIPVSAAGKRHKRELREQLP